MYREQYEQKCPTCGEWISATAVKCFHCGERIGPDDDDEPEVAPRGNPRAVVGWLLVVAVVVGVGVAAWRFGGAWLEGDRPPGPRENLEVQAEQLHRMLGQHAGHDSLNASSAVTWAEIEPHLRQGMPFDELTRLVAAKDAGAGGRTTFGNAPADDPGAVRSMLVYLRDATLTVRLDEGERVVSWMSRPPK